VDTVDADVVPVDGVPVDVVPVDKMLAVQAPAGEDIWAAADWAVAWVVAIILPVGEVMAAVRILPTAIKVAIKGLARLPQVYSAIISQDAARVVMVVESDEGAVLAAGTIAKIIVLVGRQLAIAEAAGWAITSPDAGSVVAVCSILIPMGAVAA
jgi:hypothetical protein